MNNKTIAFSAIGPKQFRRELRTARLSGERRARTDLEFAALNITERFLVSLALRSVEARDAGDTQTSDALAHVVEQMATPPTTPKTEVERMTPDEFSRQAVALPARDQQMLLAFMCSLLASQRPTKGAHPMPPRAV